MNEVFGTILETNLESSQGLDSDLDSSGAGLVGTLGSTWKKKEQIISRGIHI